MNKINNARSWNSISTKINPSLPSSPLISNERQFGWKFYFYELSRSRHSNIYRVQRIFPLFFTQTMNSFHLKNWYIYVKIFKKKHESDKSKSVSSRHVNNILCVETRSRRVCLSCWRRCVCSSARFSIRSRSMYEWEKRRWLFDVFCNVTTWYCSTCSLFKIKELFYFISMK
jgi:hypothetical protein